MIHTLQITVKCEECQARVTVVQDGDDVNLEQMAEQLGVEGWLATDEETELCPAHAEAYRLRIADDAAEESNDDWYNHPGRDQVAEINRGGA